MTEPKFTPGPWLPHIAFNDPEGFPELCVDVMKAATRDDYKLIAAAPELYEACKIFVEWLRREEAGFDHKTHDRNTPEGEAAWREWFYGNLEICGEAQDKAKAALAKARGESHD